VICVLAFATIELVSFVVYEGKYVIIAILTVDDIRALAFLNPIIAAASVNDVIASSPNREESSPGPA